jgi:multidrug efflux pump subunit AcrA (membrane-fusion protein)
MRSPFWYGLALGLLGVLAALILAGCGQSQSKTAFAGFPPAEVNVVSLAPHNFPVAFEHVAQTIGSKDVEVRARVTGIIEQRLYTEGSPVKAGQPLFIIDPKPYAAQVAQAQAELARAQAQKAQADREKARLAPLAERKAIGQKEADDAASNADLPRPRFSRRRRGSTSSSSTGATPRSSRRSRAFPAGRRSPKAASRPPTRRCSRRSRRRIRSG